MEAAGEIELGTTIEALRESPLGQMAEYAAENPVETAMIGVDLVTLALAGTAVVPTIALKKLSEQIGKNAFGTLVKQGVKQPLISTSKMVQTVVTKTPKVSKSKLAKPSIKANSVNAQELLGNKLTILQSAQKNAVKTRTLPDGRVRYYAKEISASKAGATRGASRVTEYNPKTGGVKSWHESYNQHGKVNRVHPKDIDGQKIKSQHYPLTQKELELLKIKNME